MPDSRIVPPPPKYDKGARRKNTTSGRHEAEKRLHVNEKHPIFGEISILDGQERTITVPLGGSKIIHE